eukprot:3998627-Pyramimonas_sp.AAC.1
MGHPAQASGGLAKASSPSPRAAFRTPLSLLMHNPHVGPPAPPLSVHAGSAGSFGLDLDLVF